MPFTAVDPLPSNVHVDLGQPFAVNVTLGGVVDGGVPLTPNVRLDAQIGFYRHVGASTSSTVDWSQRRALVRLEWYVGQDPGMRALRNAAQGRSQ